jgi:Transposase DDE domain
MVNTFISAETLLNYFPDSLLDKLSLEHKVDYQVKKLNGKLVFKWLLYGVLSSNELSLNVLMNIFETLEFKSYAGIDSTLTTKRNSLADRLSSINVDFIKGIFQHCQGLADKHKVLKKSHQVLGYNLNRFDSTLVGISSKLLSDDLGFTSGKKTKEGVHAIKKLKFSIGFDGLGIKALDLYTQQTHNSEDVSLGLTLKDIVCQQDEAIVIDRGIQSRNTYQTLDQQNKKFLVRAYDHVRFKIIESLPLPEQPVQDGLELIDYQIVHLKSKANKFIEVPLKLARFKIISTGKMLNLISNIDNLDAFELAFMYRRRWDIEVFFRFIKQEMGFSHLISRSENGIKVMAMIILIAAMLILLYKNINQLKGYKITKMKFANELHLMLIKEIIIRCNGDPELLKTLL